MSHFLKPGFQNQGRGLEKYNGQARFLPEKDDFLANYACNWVTY